MAFLQPRLRGSGSLIVTETVMEGSHGSCVWNETSGTECALPRGFGGREAVPDEEPPLGTVAGHVTPDDVSITAEPLLSPFSVPVPMSWETLVWHQGKDGVSTQLSCRHVRTCSRRTSPHVRDRCPAGRVGIDPKPRQAVTVVTGSGTSAHNAETQEADTGLGEAELARGCGAQGRSRGVRPRSGRRAAPSVAGPGREDRGVPGEGGRVWPLPCAQLCG